MTLALSLILFFIFSFLSAIHMYWALGGQRGKDAAIPADGNNNKVIFPGFLSTLAVALGLFGMGLLVLVEGRILDISIPRLLSRYGLWIIAAIFLIRAVGEFKFVGFFKKVKHTGFGQNDTRYYSPLCLATGLLTIILELIR